MFLPANGAVYSMPIVHVYRAEMSRVFFCDPHEHAFTWLPEGFSNNCNTDSIDCFQLLDQILSMLWSQKCEKQT